MQHEDVAKLFQESVLAGVEEQFPYSQLSDHLTKSAAYRLYGRTTVDRWITEHLITPKANLIPRRTLEVIAAQSNRLSYLTTKSR